LPELASLAGVLCLLTRLLLTAALLLLAGLLARVLLTRVLGLLAGFLIWIAHAGSPLLKTSRRTTSAWPVGLRGNGGSGAFLMCRWNVIAAAAEPAVKTILYKPFC
jgi:hypothetical protein